MTAQAAAETTSHTRLTSESPPRKARILPQRKNESAAVAPTSLLTLVMISASPGSRATAPGITKRRGLRGDVSSRVIPQAANIVAM